MACDVNQGYLTSVSSDSPYYSGELLLLLLLMLLLFCCYCCYVVVGVVSQYNHPDPPPSILLFSTDATLYMAISRGPRSIFPTYHIIF